MTSSFQPMAATNGKTAFYTGGLRSWGRGMSVNGLGALAHARRGQQGDDVRAEHREESC
jgi:hypothetical protein